MSIDVNRQSRFSAPIAGPSCDFRSYCSAIRQTADHPSGTRRRWL